VAVVANWDQLLGQQIQEQTPQTMTGTPQPILERLLQEVLPLDMKVVLSLSEHPYRKTA
jgi:hypothetical protein